MASLTLSSVHQNASLQSTVNRTGADNKSARKGIQFSPNKPIVIDYCQESEDEEEIVYVSTNQEIDYDEQSDERAKLREVTETNTRFNSSYSNFKLQDGAAPDSAKTSAAAPIKFVIQSGNTRQPLKLKNPFLEQSINKTSKASSNGTPTAKSGARPQAQPPNRPPPPPPLPSSVRAPETETCQSLGNNQTQKERIQIDKIDLDKIRIPRASIGSTLTREPAKEQEKQVLVLESVGGSILTIQGQDFDDSKHDSMSDSGSDSGASGLDPSRSPSQSPTQDPHNDDSVADSTSSGSPPDSLESALHDNSFGAISDNDNCAVESLPRDKENAFDNPKSDSAAAIPLPLSGQQAHETFPKTSTTVQTNPASDDGQSINFASSDGEQDQTAVISMNSSVPPTPLEKGLSNNKTTIRINYDASIGAPQIDPKINSALSGAVPASPSDHVKRSKMLNSLAADLEMHRSSDSQSQSLNSCAQVTPTAVQAVPVTEPRRMITFSDPKLLRDCFAGDSDDESARHRNEETPKKSKLFSFGRGKAKQIKRDSDSSDSEYEGLADEIVAEEDNHPPEMDSHDSDLDSEEDFKKKNDKKPMKLLKNMTKKTTKFWAVTTKKIADKSKFGEGAQQYYPGSSSSSISQESATKPEVLEQDKKDKKKKPLAYLAKNALKNFEGKIKNSKSANEAREKKTLNKTEAVMGEPVPTFRRLDSMDDSIDNGVRPQTVSSTIFSPQETDEHQAPPKAPVRRKKLARKRNEMLDELKAQEYRVERTKQEFEHFLKHDGFEAETMSQICLTSKQFFTTQKVCGSDREFMVLIGSKDLHWITTFDAFDSSTVNIQRHPCRILPGEFDTVVPMSEFVQQMQTPGSRGSSNTTKFLVDSVVCQLFSVTSQYESSNCQSRMIGDFKQTLIARSSQDVIVLVPFVTNSQPQPESDGFNREFGALSMTQAYNVQYYCLSILRALSMLDPRPYSSLQARIKSGIASPNDLNILFSLDCFVPNRGEIEAFLSRKNCLRDSVYTMLDYLRLCFVINTKPSYAVELSRKDCV